MPGSGDLDLSQVSLLSLPLPLPGTLTFLSPAGCLRVRVLAEVLQGEALTISWVTGAPLADSRPIVPG